MDLKRFIILLLAILIVFVGIKYGVKKYIFPYEYKEYVDKYSLEYNLDPLLVLSIMKTESGFDENAKSNKGAKGLMQIMDSTGNWISEEVGVYYFFPNMLYDPELNIRFGCWYVDNLRTEFADLDLILAAYNAGSGNVTKWLADEKYSEDGKTLSYIPFNETKKYVDRVKTNYSIYKYLYN